MMAISTQPNLNKNSVGGVSVDVEGGVSVGVDGGESMGVDGGVSVDVEFEVGVGFTVIITVLERGDVTGVEALSVISQVTVAELPDAV